MCYEGALEKLKKYPFSCKIAVMMKWNNGSDFTCSVIIDFMVSDILDKRYLVNCHLWPLNRAIFTLYIDAQGIITLTTIIISFSRYPKN